MGIADGGGGGILGDDEEFRELVSVGGRKEDTGWFETTLREMDHLIVKMSRTFLRKWFFVRYFGLLMTSGIYILV